VAMLYPFWGKQPEDPGDPNRGRFDRYVELGPKLFKLAPLDQAALAVFPCEWQPALAAEVERMVHTAASFGRRTVLFIGGDDYQQVPYESATVFQASLYRSSRRENEFAQPAWSEDFVTAHLDGRLPIRPKRDNPVVGFCGLAPGRRKLLQRLRSHPSHTSVRARALELLRNADGVETNFVERERFLGGAVRGGRYDVATMQRVRREYVENIVESDYVLCTRGAGNFSYRLYEALSCGRIPILVDTDCVLPYDFFVDWRSLCVWIAEEELPRIGEKLRAFHDQLTDADFGELQRSCRRFWEQYISPSGFFSNFHHHFDA
jgi:hypothetical protein